MDNPPRNLFDPVEPVIPGVDGEHIETFIRSSGVRIERVVSHGHASPEGFWYDQEENEWVVLLSGGAKVRFEADDNVIEMRPGDHIHIPAHVRHRVDWTEPDTDTVWLAVFYPVD